VRTRAHVAPGGDDAGTQQGDRLSRWPRLTAARPRTRESSMGARYCSYRVCASPPGGFKLRQSQDAWRQQAHGMIAACPGDDRMRKDAYHACGMRRRRHQLVTAKPRCRLSLAQRLECRPDLGREQFGLFPGGGTPEFLSMSVGRPAQIAQFGAPALRRAGIHGGTTFGGSSSSSVRGRAGSKVGKLQECVVRCVVFRRRAGRTRR
jgi:hypothetical protein